MKKILIEFLLGIILCSGIVYASNYLATDISYEPSDASWEVDNVNEALNDLYFEQQNNTKKSLVFTSSPVDMKQYTDRWAELTNVDFKACISGISVSASSGGDGETNGSSISRSYSPSFSYNQSTGILTFNNISWNESYQKSSYNNSVRTNGSANVFIVWLGTVGGN